MKAGATLAGVAAGLSLVAATALAQPYGPGPGMMGGHGGGGHGMGQGMMHGGPFDGAYTGLDLSTEQRQKIADIEAESRRAMWQLMGAMHGRDHHMRGMMGPGPIDEAAARQSYEAMAETHKAMFEMRLDARKRIEAVLTDEQRGRLRKYWGPR